MSNAIYGSVARSVAQTENNLKELAKERSVSSAWMQKIEQDLDSLSNRISNRNNSNEQGDTTSRNNRNHDTPKRNIPAQNETIDHEVILIGDSNTKNLDMATIGRGYKRKRFTVYTIPQAVQFLNTCTIVKQPKKVVLHLGTNDVAIPNSDVEQLHSDFDELIALTRHKFSDARIYISSIFPRMNKNDRLNSNIKQLNSYLGNYCDGTPNFTLIDNSNIYHRDMADPKHVNPTGLHTFICNIKVTVFGEKYNSPRWR